MSQPVKKNPLVDNIMLVIVAIILGALGVMFAGYLASKSSILCSRIDPADEKCIVSNKNFFEYKKTVIPINQISGIDIEIGKKNSLLYLKTTGQGNVYLHFSEMKGFNERKVMDDFEGFLKNKNLKTFEAITDTRITFYCIGAAFLTLSILLVLGLIVRILIFFCDMIF